ncbi:hypothetical protein [Streptomyces sp. LaPpAH-108]|uniref:hypothetical protein n=1 Tax=Streptomyces sp. LaPpAH-108 TaxID=1155714 RepID=UPI0003773089|nr:hypothetical protein [Streptomyces sp. LaPpAH-108]
MTWQVAHRPLDDLALARTLAASRTLQGTELPPDTIRHRLLSADRVIALTDSEGQPLAPFAQEVVKWRTLGEGRRIVVLGRACRVGGGVRPGGRLAEAASSGEAEDGPALG